MKKFLKYAAFLLLILVALLVYSWIIINPSPNRCEVVEITATRIYEGGDQDIMIASPKGEIYYINRGLEQGYSIEWMEKKIKNKKVTLHLPKQLFGAVTSNHIAQLVCWNKVVYTEFE
ncbi:MAG: hypothetical protein KTR22_05190 [Flavobacteriaceae bacterium]|nr:hypothetical protein [Flavobacteriaceae bacterium]